MPLVEGLTADTTAALFRDLGCFPLPPRALAASQVLSQLLFLAAAYPERVEDFVNSL